MRGTLFRGYLEPVHRWAHYNGHNLLEEMYNESGTESPWLRRFQTKVILDLVRQDEEIRSLLGIAICVQERDLESVINVFLPLNKARLPPVDYQLLLDSAKFGRNLNAGRNRKKSIYLHCDSKKGYERMKSRGRKEESNMTFQEFERINEKMCLLQENADVVVDTTNMSKKDVFDFVHRVITTGKVE